MTLLGLAKLRTGPGHLGVVERPWRAPGGGEVCVSVEATGICGTDLHIEDGEYPTSVPVTIGHEVCGSVSELGEGVEEAWLGARVVCETFFSTCEACQYCVSDRRNLCAKRRSIGTHVDGAFAPRLVVPAVNLHRVPEWLESPAAAMAEPLACVCNALFDPPVVNPGDSVLVVGPGAIGLLAAQAARAAGAVAEVRGAARDAARLECAQRLGFRTSTDGDCEQSADFDVVIECSGSERGLSYALDAVRRRGAFVLLGLHGSTVNVHFDEVCYRELAMRSGFASTRASWRRAMAMIRERRVDLGCLVSDVVPLDGWRAAFDASRSGEGIKFVISPGR